MNLGEGSNIELAERCVLDLRNSFGNNNSAVSNRTEEQLPGSEMCNSKDLRIPSVIPTCISTDSQGVCDVSDKVGDAEDYRGILAASDGVNKADNYQGMQSVSRDEAGDSSNVCQISGNELAEVAESPSISVTDDDRRLGNVSTLAGTEAKTECIGAESNSQMYNIFASVLVVSHGGLLMELLAYFVKELKCILSESQRARFRIIPNAGVSKFAVQIGDGTKAFPKVICLSVFETDHLVVGNEDVTPLVSSADFI